MAFSSSVPPAYNLDHHTNWHHQLQQQPNNHHHHQQQQQQLVQNPHLPAPPAHQVDQGSIRPGSMVDRARIAKLPLPEAGLNCPRCDSTQTKFCYFNNYSLTQPRHFCKTCRRYWTRGGALRSVPVGGGCRRNKRTKTRTSKSPNITNNNQKAPSSSNNISTESPSRSADQMVANHNNNNPFSSQVPLMAALQNLNSHYGGSTYGGFQMGNNGSSGQSDMRFQLGHNTTSDVTNNILTSGGSAQGTWRLPILTGFEQPSGNSNLFSYQGEGIEAASSGQVKVEEPRGGLNLSSQFLGVSDHQNNTNNSNSNHQYWDTSAGGNSWTTDFTSHINNTTTSSSASPFL